QLQNAKSLQQEFITQLRDYTAPERTAVAFEANVKRNRYRDIPCFDQERVILCKWPHDYINANYFNAPDGVKYIATQADHMDTQSDFWQMVVQEEATIILQLCKFIEGETEKCAEYWPSDLKTSITVIDKFTIRRMSKPEEVVPGTTKTMLRVESKAGNRLVQHLLCDAWPDALAPSDPNTILKLWNKQEVKAKPGPVVVHCSAGVGRTATFIALSYGVEILKKPGTSVADVVKEARKVRAKAVQTPVQYIFLHCCYLELFIQMNLIQRTPAVVALFDNLRKYIEKKLEKREKTEKS
ncbi:hypothetical protein PFISCL1PPCAC_11540, partial [Pristionchus fissidentatus]